MKKLMLRGARKGKAFVAGGSEYMDEPLAASASGLNLFLRLSHSGSKAAQMAAQMNRGIGAICRSLFV